MVLKPDIIAEALEQNNAKNIFYLSPRGKVFNQKIARQLAQEQEISLLCGRYEGVDQRVLDEFNITEISIGDYVLSGGEIAALVVIDAILRNVEGVLGANESLSEESFGEGDFANLLEYPHYTRPQSWRGREVPEVLASGNHKKINEWRKEEALLVTKKNRPELIG
jgi:tRNA (guanine37-N1)-methyltransferase